MDKEFKLLPLHSSDHPDCRVMRWSESEMRAIKDYAIKCIEANLPAPNAQGAAVSDDPGKILDHIAEGIENQIVNAGHRGDLYDAGYLRAINREVIRLKEIIKQSRPLTTKESSEPVTTKESSEPVTIRIGQTFKHPSHGEVCYLGPDRYYGQLTCKLERLDSKSLSKVVYPLWDEMLKDGFRCDL